MHLFWLMALDSVLWYCMQLEVDRFSDVCI